jgi:hypothetical protein
MSVATAEARHEVVARCSNGEGGFCVLEASRSRPTARLDDGLLPLGLAHKSSSSAMDTTGEALKWRMSNTTRMDVAVKFRREMEAAFGASERVISLIVLTEFAVIDPARVTKREATCAR